MRTSLIWLATTVVLGVGAFALNVAPESASLKPCVSFNGAHSSIGTPRIEIIRDAAAWKALWVEHRGDRVDTSVYGPEAPVIDFTRYDVIAVFSGEAWNCNGHFVVDVADLAETRRVRFDSHTFQTAGPGGGGVKSRPYGIWVLPRTARPIVLEENVQGLIGHPPVWKERARFEPRTP